MIIRRRPHYPLLVLLSLLALAPATHAQPAPDIAAKSYLLSDFQSGQTLVGHSVDTRVEPASLTKLMTSYLVFAALKQKRITPTQTVPVSENAWRTSGSRMFIDPKKAVSVEELLRGMIVQSGNDATIALAEAIAGTEAAFAKMMNSEAERLGLKNTHYVNATGLPDAQHYTSASDLVVLAAALLRDFPEHYPLYAVKEYQYNDITQPNRNRLLWLDPHVDGLKTGHTESAGYCLIASAKRGERRLIAVVLGAASDTARTIESQRLLNHGFQHFETVRLYQQGQAVVSMPLWKGAETAIKAGFNRDFYYTLPTGMANKLQATATYPQPLFAPITAGDKIGRFKLALDGKAVAEYPLAALETVPLGNIFGRAWDSLRLMFD